MWSHQFFFCWSSKQYSIYLQSAGISGLPFNVAVFFCYTKNGWLVCSVCLFLSFNLITIKIDTIVYVTIQLILIVKHSVPLKREENGTAMSREFVLRGILITAVVLY